MILVFGKSGQVASELAKFADIKCLGRDEADLTNPTSCIRAIHHYSPSAVINAAAYTAVDQAESNKSTAILVNAIAPAEMAATCAVLNIPFTHISSDYVFDGSGEKPWRETDNTAPLGVYGLTKRDGEVGTLAANPASIILRTSWVFSEHGMNFVKTMLALGTKRDRLSIVADQIGGPTPAAAVAKACHHIAMHFDARKTGIYHFAATPHANWADFARTIFSMANLNVHVDDISTANYPTAAKRPLNSRLDCSRVLNDFGIKEPKWQPALKKVLKKLETA